MRYLYSVQRTLSILHRVSRTHEITGTSGIAKFSASYHKNFSTASEPKKPFDQDNSRAEYEYQAPPNNAKQTLGKMERLPISEMYRFAKAGELAQAKKIWEELVETMNQFGGKRIDSTNSLDGKISKNLLLLNMFIAINLFGFVMVIVKIVREMYPVTQYFKPEQDPAILDVFVPISFEEFMQKYLKGGKVKSIAHYPSRQKAIVFLKKPIGDIKEVVVDCAKVGDTDEFREIVDEAIADAKDDVDISEEKSSKLTIWDELLASGVLVISAFISFFLFKSLRYLYFVQRTLSILHRASRTHKI